MSPSMRPSMRSMPLRKRPVRAVGLSDDPTWYKDAILYELRVRSFMDGNGDGVGDFVGLTSKLDYLQDLGVTALWLLPFYPSPGRDDGYDIGEYTDVHPELGTLDEFKEFLDEAHRRGLRVITELVINHTSDQHAWFQRARRAPPGSPERDFYVWSDTPERYKDTRIIFKDFEPSNWSWDPVAKAYFWHRFYAHQPDLNFDNPAVHEAVLSVLDFWLDMGVDGLRLDAVPYLYEREGTNCENLPETHAFLKELRAHVDARHPNRMLLAEANQWPEDAAAYFGDGDECHMNFHFPIMPRLFMSIHMEDRFPIIDILEQTPALDDRSQWALFLRNHDELTLEMVTEEERDYMWRAFAHDPTMRINLGIRRRLAPLVGNNRRNIELMNGLLFSMPGTPVLYYGDEIGMGDNVYLGDRNGVRTPMQWSADRNAGFSRANPQKLILPVIIDPEYHFESVNVEAQQNNTNSLLWWTKRLIALRKRFRAFGRGSIAFLSPDNPRVLAFIREHEDERILVVANLSRHVQYVELDLSEYEGMTPIELFGRSTFPRIGELPYLLTLGGHAFYWFSLEAPESAEDEARAAAYEPPHLTIRGPWETLLTGEAQKALEDVLPAFIASRRWFPDPWREITRATLTDVVPLRSAEGGTPVSVAVVEVEPHLHEPETYILPLAFAVGEAAREVHARAGGGVVADVTYLARDGGPMSGCLYDVLADPPSAKALFDAMASGATSRGLRGEILASALVPLPGPAEPLEARFIRGEHVSPAVVVDERWVLKVFRRVAEGLGPEIEVGRFLAAKGDEAPTARLAGALEYRTRRNEAPTSLAVLHTFSPHESNARLHALGELERYFERALTLSADAPRAASRGTLVERARIQPPAEVQDLIGSYLDVADLLGRRTAELHHALCAPDTPAFAPEPFSSFDQRSVYQSMRNLAGTVLRSLKQRVRGLPEPAAELAGRVLAARDALYERFSPLLDRRMTSARTRFHGDLHLEKLLYTGRDFVVIDFEGDRARPGTDRRRKRSPLRDAASMIRSFHDAAYSALLDESVVRDSDRGEAAGWADLWLDWVGATYLGAWLAAAGDAPFVPTDERELAVLLDVFQMERLLQEIGGGLEREQHQRLVIPLMGLTRQLASS